MAANTELLVRLVGQRVGLSAGQLEAIRTGDVNALLSEGWADTPQQHGDELERARGSLRATTRRLNAVQEQLDAALGVLHQLAEMLGCCVRCWGTNQLCPTCRGAGSPGFRAPDAGLGDWVEPALRRSSRRLPPPPVPVPTNHETRRGE